MTDEEKIDALTLAYREIRKENFELKKQLEGCSKNREYWYDVAHGYIDKDE